MRMQFNWDNSEGIAAQKKK